jgi:hypothetical protein
MMDTMRLDEKGNPVKRPNENSSKIPNEIANVSDDAELLGDDFSEIEEIASQEPDDIETLTRRDFIRMAWTAPVIAAIGLSAPTKTAHAQSSHLDYTDHSDYSDHSDQAYIDHVDWPWRHTDYYYDHSDHGDVIHSDHIDEHTDTHVDLHIDGHLDFHTDEHGDSNVHFDHTDHVDHNDAALAGSQIVSSSEHEDVSHLDTHDDSHDDGHDDQYQDHQDVLLIDQNGGHEDTLHQDHIDHSDKHGDHGDDSQSLGGHTDLVAPDFQEDSHKDVSHLDVSSHDDHLDHIDSP